MSNALAIASVTAVLKDLLDNAVIDASLTAAVGGPVTVTALPPDRIKVGDDEQVQLNLFLYQVTPNASWRNVDLPSRDDRGQRLTNPPLALDLHYLLSAYGRRDFEAEILLGYAMHALHETPLLTRDAVRTALTPSPLPGVPLPGGPLAASDLAEQVELVKITPQPMTTEEISRLWSALQSHYRPTTAYQASVVLIQSKQPTRPSLPVRERNVYAIPFAQIVIEAVESADGPSRPILAGGGLVVRGRRLRGQVTRVLMDGQEVAPLTPPLIGDERIEFTLTTPPVPAALLRAGIHGVQVLHRIPMGTPPADHEGFESNVGPFVLQPEVALVGTVYQIDVPELLPDAGGTRRGRMTVTLSPTVGVRQRVLLMLNERDPVGPPRAYTFEAEPRGADGTLVEFRFAGVAPATYLVRVQVDGAETPLDTDPATGQYVGPSQAII